MIIIGRTIRMMENMPIQFQVLVLEICVQPVVSGGKFLGSLEIEMVS